MKKITMFYQERCPHCKKARALIEELFVSHPEYKEVPLKMVEENKEPDTAAKYDYYYVPTFYVDDEKVHEGVPTAEAVQGVFQAAVK